MESAFLGEFSDAQEVCVPKLPSEHVGEEEKFTDPLRCEALPWAQSMLRGSPSPL